MIICRKSMRSCTVGKTNDWLLSEWYCRTNQCHCMVTVLLMNTVHSTNNLQHVKWKLLQEVKVTAKTCSYSPSRWYTLFQHIQSTITYTCNLQMLSTKCHWAHCIEWISKLLNLRGSNLQFWWSKSSMTSLSPQVPEQHTWLRNTTQAHYHLMSL